jgi:iron complex outermembrane recepter protein
VQDRAIHWAVGALHRIETAASKLDPAKLGGVTGAAPTTLGDADDFTANEVYVESSVPLLRGLPAAVELDLTGGLRYSDFSSFGSVTTYQAGLMYRPVSQLTLRGGYGTVFRAPPIVSLYSSNLIVGGDQIDPCGNGPTPAQAANCAANGVPGGSYEQDPESVVPNVTGGNEDLQPEQGDSLSAGLTLVPAALPGFELSVDYWRTTLDDVIRIDPGGQLYVDSCADSGATDACEKIQRRPDGSIAMIDARNANGRSLLAEGYDFDVGYVTALGSGRLSARLMATYLSRFDFVPVAGAGTMHLAGTDMSWGALPRWRGLGYVDYSQGPWSASYQAQYIGTMKECGTAFPANAFNGCRTIDDRWYQDVRLQYEFDRGLTLSLAVNNVAGTEPPRVNFFSTGANTDVAAYRLLGRTYFVSLSYRIE